MGASLPNSYSMRSLFVLVLLALTRVRAGNAETAFVDGQRIPSPAAAMDSSSTASQLNQAALLGSGSVLSNAANNAWSYSNAEESTISTWTIPQRTKPPSLPSTPSPTPSLPPKQDTTLSGFTAQELSSSRSSFPSTTAASTENTITIMTTAAPTMTATATATIVSAATKNLDSLAADSSGTKATTTPPTATTTTTFAPRMTSEAVFSGNGSAADRVDVKNDYDKETDSVTIRVTPAPEETIEPSNDSNDTREESAEGSPESAIDSRVLEPHLTKGPDRPIDGQLPMEDATDLIEENSSSSDIPEEPEMVIFNDLQNSFIENFAGNVASSEPEVITFPESSSEPHVAVTSGLGSMIDLPSSLESPTPHPSVKSFDGTEAFLLAALAAESPFPSFENNDSIGPVPMPSAEVVVLGVEGLDTVEPLEPTLAPPDEIYFIFPVEEDIKPSGEPERYAEPEPTTEKLLPDGEMELLEVDLFVNHPASFEPTSVAEKVKLVSNEEGTRLQWTEVGLFLVSNLSQFGSVTSVVRNADEFSAFELNLQSTCADPSGCETEMNKYNSFVRDGGMDKSLAAHNINGVKVLLKDDVIDESESESASESKGLHSAALSGPKIGLIVGITAGVASIVIYGVLLVVKRAKRNDDNDAEQGRSESHHGEEEEQTQARNHTEQEDSFMISNFGGSSRNTEAMTPWMGNSSEGSASHDQESSSSFITVDTAVTSELTSNNLTNYRYEEEISLGSSAGSGDLDFDEGRSDRS